MGGSEPKERPKEADRSRTRIALVPPGPEQSDPSLHAEAIKETVALSREHTGEEPCPLSPTSNQLHLVPGVQIPGTRYCIIRWLGDGGMGVVYEAEHVDIERRVAVKILRHEICQNPRMLELFREEARAAGRVGSENIAEIYDFAELSDGRLMYAMELLDGPTLAVELTQGPMDAARVIGIGRQICKGLAAAHDVGIVHRDIKPENIVLDRKHRRHDVVKLLDFGIATVLEDALEGTSTAAGTPHYLGPEAVAGLPFDGRLDQYALGCTLYEMLTGSPPFEASSVAELMRAQLEQEPTPPSKHCPRGTVPAALERVILRCLAKSPGARYQDMRDLEAALCEAQIDAGLQTGWDDLPLPDVDPERRAWLLESMPDPATSTAVGLRLPRKRKVGLIAATIGLIVVAGATAGAYALWPRQRPPVAQQARDPVSLLVQQARAAASRSYFVLPGVGEGDRETPAFERILQLERLGTPEAFQQAQLLREEFASTLIRLGDEMWIQEGGKPFAAQYYAQALVFDPDNEHANTRASLSNGEIEHLQTKAKTQSFSKRELQTGESLAELARSDRQERRRRLAEHRSRKKQQAQQPDRDATKGAEPTRSSSGTEQEDRNRNESESANPEKSRPSSGEDEAKRQKQVAPPPSKPQRDPTQSRALSKKAHAALGAGRDAQARALFEQALGLDPRNPEALAGLSDLHFNRGSYSKALRHAKRAVRARPSNPSYRIKLGDAYYKVLRYQQALEQYQKAEELGYDGAKWRIDKVQAKLGS